MRRSPLTLPGVPRRTRSNQSLQPPHRLRIIQIQNHALFLGRHFFNLPAMRPNHRPRPNIQRRRHQFRKQSRSKKHRMPPPPKKGRQNNRLPRTIKSRNNPPNQPQSNKWMIHRTNQSPLDIGIRQTPQPSPNRRKRSRLPLLINNNLRIAHRQPPPNLRSPSPQHPPSLPNPRQTSSSQQMFDER